LNKRRHYGCNATLYRLEKSPQKETCWLVREKLREEGGTMGLKRKMDGGKSYIRKVTAWQGK